MAELSKLELDESKFLDLLEKLIGESKYLQNNPPELVPVEDRYGGCCWMLWTVATAFCAC